MTKLNIVLDTNVLLVSISSKSKYHWIFKALLSGEYNLFITNEILTESEEVIAVKWNYQTSKYLIRTLIELNNVYKSEIYYRLNLIKNDPDDNKFVDCAFASNADFIVSHDHDFDVLENIEFPDINVIQVDEFKKALYPYDKHL